MSKELSVAETGLADALFNINAVRFGAFKLKLHKQNPEAPLSPVYIDLRVVRSHPRVMTEIVEKFRQMSLGLKFDCFADVPTSATPIVAVLSYLTGVPMITPRETKTHGKPGNIDGAFQPGQVVLLCDDLVTKAGSKLEAIKTLEANGLKVNDVLVLLDRGQGEKEELKRAGYNLHAAFTLLQLLAHYANTYKITSKKYEEIMAYLTNN